MPAKDMYHDMVKHALINDGWTITHDPLTLKSGVRDLFIDLGAEQLLAAEKRERKIAVEIKSFTGPSDIYALEQALGQYILYHDILADQEPERRLYLAIHEETWHDIFEEPIGNMLLKNKRLCLVIFNVSQEAIVQWIE